MNNSNPNSFTKLSSKHINKAHTPHYQNESAYQDIKSKQLISHMLDTFDDSQNKSKVELKNSLNNFDKTIQSFYVSSSRRADRLNGNVNALQNSSNEGRHMNQQYDRTQHLMKGSKRVVQSSKPYVWQGSQTMNMKSSVWNNPSNLRDSSHKNHSQHKEKSTIQRKEPTHNLLSTKKYQLKVPKPNTLTDKFMRLILGSEESLINSYDRTVNPKSDIEKNQQQAQEQRRRLIKEAFLNSKYDNKSSGKPTIRQHQYPFQTEDIVAPKAFFDDKYLSYLENNVHYLENLNRLSDSAFNRASYMQHKKVINSSAENFENRRNVSKMQAFQNYCNRDGSMIGLFKQSDKTDNKKSFIEKNRNCQFFVEKDKAHNDNEIEAQNRNKNSFIPNQHISSPPKVFEKIKETGGIENTIRKMQKSLKKNQLSHMNKNQYISNEPHRQEGQLVNRILKQKYDNSARVQHLTPQKGEQENPKYLTHAGHSFKVDDTTNDKVIQKPQFKGGNWKQKSKSLRSKYNRGSASINASIS